VVLVPKILELISYEFDALNSNMPLIFAYQLEFLKYQHFIELYITLFLKKNHSLNKQIKQEFFIILHRYLLYTEENRKSNHLNQLLTEHFGNFFCVTFLNAF